MPELSWHDVRVGRALSKGASTKVKEASFRNQRKKFAIKYLRSSSKSNPLSHEAQFLTTLNHENIVQLHAHGFLKGSRQFLIMDRLDETLDHLLSDWIFLLPGFMAFQGEKAKASSGIPSPRERIQSIALPLARAMEYVHSNRIVMGNLKPSNVGIHKGTVKLFDFESAVRLDDDDEMVTGRGVEGSSSSPLYYTAPEVMQSQDYGLPADVYSFAMILWELLTLDVPFEDMSRDELVRAVVQEKARPAVDKRIGSPALQELISNAWKSSPDSRPTFTTIRRVLEDEVAALGTDDFTIETDQIPPTILIRQ
jgi:serine/threonine protein kinase